MFSQPSQIVSTINLHWTILAAIDAALTSKFIDKNGVSSHKYRVTECVTKRAGDDICNVEAVEKWLAKDNERAREVFDFKKVEYLETDGFRQLGNSSGEQFSASFRG